MSSSRKYIGQSLPRVDALEKVTGQARYTDDMLDRPALTAKILHSTIANGRVVRIDASRAEALPGVRKVVTCFDVPDIVFPTAGHPWSTEAAHQDVADRHLLERRVRFYGDSIAAVVADDELTATQALRLIDVEYEEYKPIITVEQAMSPDATQLHDAFPGNLLKQTGYELGDFNAAIQTPGLIKFEGVYETPTVQHCHIENPVSYAYMEAGKIVVVTSTQIPHIVRRVVGTALGIPWGSVRVIKPYIGGGFGNKQDVLFEPLNAYLCKVMGGKCVRLEATREETFACTRVRHAMKFHITTYARPDGRFVAREMEGWSNQGAYASHGHALIANAANAFRQLYQDELATKCTVSTYFTNLPVGGAMRGYGIPQGVFAMESHVDEIASGLGIDPLELRRKNMMTPGFEDPYLHIKANTNGLEECIRKGREFIHWDEKRAAYAHQTGPVRHGVGMAIFSYKTGVYPISLETASCRMVLNQDGSIQLIMGATEIGQGADTVFTQMAADTVGIPIESVHIISAQDTDVTPFDPGAYASRQTYVSGMALKKVGTILREKIIDYAHKMLKRPIDEIDLEDGFICEMATGKQLLTLAEVATEAFYSLTDSVHITAEATSQCKSNTFALGLAFAEVTVDIPLGKVTVDNIINVHDSGILINPQLATMQVEGGMSMGLGYGLYEQLLIDEKTGRVLNDNLLDYKLMTMLDTPDLNVDFVETDDPTGPFGNKALGEPPALPPAPAIRNAVLNATGVAMNRIPMTPQRLVEAFTKVGLITPLY